MISFAYGSRNKFWHWHCILFHCDTSSLKNSCHEDKTSVIRKHPRKILLMLPTTSSVFLVSIRLQSTLWTIWFCDFSLLLRRFHFSGGCKSSSLEKHFYVNDIIQNGTSNLSKGKNKTSSNLPGRPIKKQNNTCRSKLLGMNNGRSCQTWIKYFDFLIQDMK